MALHNLNWHIDAINHMLHKLIKLNKYLRSSSMSRTFASKLLQAFSFNWSSFILLFIVIVFLVIFLPGLLIRSSQGSHCRNTLLT